MFLKVPFEKLNFEKSQQKKTYPACEEIITFENVAFHVILTDDYSSIQNVSYHTCTLKNNN